MLSGLESSGRPSGCGVVFGTLAAGGVGPPPSRSHPTASHSDGRNRGAAMALTGQFQFRKTFGSKIVLQVEEEVPTVWSWFGRHGTKKRWRDATLMDLSAPALRMLLDWRFTRRPSTQLQVESSSGSAERALSASV